MANKTFALNTDPHVATVGTTDFLFQPEVNGDEFLDVYGQMRATYAEKGIDLTNMAGLSVDQLKQIEGAVRAFLCDLMLPDSAEEFRVARFPSRIYTHLFEWTLELFGGGRPSTSSNDSAGASPPVGTRGKAGSPSMGSTRTRGR